MELDPLLDKMLEQLAEAGPVGLLGAHSKISARISQLRRLDVAIETTREKRTDGGAGHLARYRLACTVQRR